MKVANIPAAIDYINQSFPKPNGRQHLLASFDGLIENRPGRITFRVYRTEFPSKVKDTLGHLLDLVIPVLSNDYERTCTADTEEYLWAIGHERYIRVWYHKRSGTFIQLFDKGN